MCESYSIIQVLYVVYRVLQYLKTVVSHIEMQIFKTMILTFSLLSDMAKCVWRRFLIG